MISINRIGTPSYEIRLMGNDPIKIISQVVDEITIKKISIKQGFVAQDNKKIRRILTLAFNLSTKNWAIGVQTGSKWIRTPFGYHETKTSSSKSYLPENLPLKWQGQVSYLTQLHYSYKWPPPPFAHIK